MDHAAIGEALVAALRTVPRNRQHSVELYIRPDQAVVALHNIENTWSNGATQRLAQLLVEAGVIGEPGR